ncbi:MAG: bifunctional DNA-formamidopyrimidine glycosylase/DNA-(apurinic or apyrimidinic site) lyase [Actinomycetota bacterium]|nr:bifunctional DNA-formamidopyrimidine glycosylase/DNA-(apurinic or apyrimidinic site) lyase [Actinomycetota bacterium]MDQ3647856.1 bifunctional DNA-formamidopyrimidine glycosylase/DNA-(apurinic or apyrimidinic site) lyase [Actinomycetota bacterium]
MPELPEVETIRRQLAPALEGKVLEGLEVLDQRWCEPAPPGELAAATEGRTIEAVTRRGKYLTLALSDEVYVVMHLRMTGNLLLVRPEEDLPGRPHLRVRFAVQDERLLFVDARRFGTGVVLLGSGARDLYFAARLGVEPLGPDFTSDALRALAKGRRAPAKAFLLSQERIAGVGNIYADEALYRAGIHPLRPVGTLRRAQVADLRDAVVASLEAGIDARGASIDDFRHSDGARGSFQDRFMVHLREGEPCRRCGATIRKLRAAGRGTYVCPRCQRAPRVRRA